MRCSALKPPICSRSPVSHSTGWGRRRSHAECARRDAHGGAGAGMLAYGSGSPAVRGGQRMFIGPLHRAAVPGREVGSVRDDLGACGPRAEQRALRPEGRGGPVSPLPGREDLHRRDGLRRDHAQRAPLDAVLHGRGDERRGGDPGANHEAREDRAARQRAADLGRPTVPGGGAGRDRHDLARAPGDGVGARDGARERGAQRAAAVQLGAVPGSARLRGEGVDDAGAVPLGGRALQLPLREPVGEAVPGSAPADLDPGRDEPQHGEVDG